MEFKNKIALVTGASRGIGRAVAVELAQRGAFVVVNYSKSESAAKEVLDEIESSGGRAKLSCFDVSDSPRVQEEIAKIGEEFGGLQILVNNAGITKDGLLLRMKDQDWDEVLAVDLKGVFNCTRAAAKMMMKERYGRIINITSVVGEMGNPGQANYSAAKAGIIGFTKSAAKELASRGITVNAVSPGFIETDITNVLPQNVKEKYMEAIPLGRFGTPEDVAKVVSFLASDGASYVTGEVVRVNGGLYT
ncbi:MAG TPA: 3-oxoacyl-[acyl-carrier-protein] reductase [Thermodesulfobacteriota bacterium]|nr:3-oxoacyl-[acyl-carrier-protein] reductase [Thermodesulfobacteriota bacterium]